MSSDISNKGAGQLDRGKVGRRGMEGGRSQV